ncbi:BlaI/MecI/CopY family transcriptional regulator [Metabacillus sp. Hm71]|uniref:BlaI/MecI/CopY family transcriptional regulator n=1 Tax=Metabacillus sp. Hm71 TaxID=3450743 RepID=UPI003F4392BC
MKKKLPQISEAELEVMKIIWKHPSINTNEVIEKLSKTSKWSPKTIQTMLLRLLKKGALSHHKEGRVFAYTPNVAESDYLEVESRSFLNRFYNGALNSMVLNFIENDKLSDDEINELYQILEERKNRKQE